MNLLLTAPCRKRVFEADGFDRQALPRFAGDNRVVAAFTAVAMRRKMDVRAMSIVRLPNE